MSPETLITVALVAIVCGTIALFPIGIFLVSAYKLLKGFIDDYKWYKRKTIKEKE